MTFPPPPNHSVRMSTIIARFNVVLKPYIESRLEGAANDEEIESVMTNLTHNIVMDMFTQEDTLYFSKLYLAGIFQEHINRILRNENGE